MKLDFHDEPILGFRTAVVSHTDLEGASSFLNPCLVVFSFDGNLESMVE